jgi:hypothetical protein
MRGGTGLSPSFLSKKFVNVSYDMYGARHALSSLVGSDIVTALARVLYTMLYSMTREPYTRKLAGQILADNLDMPL